MRLLTLLVLAALAAPAAAGPLPDGRACVDPEGWTVACATYGDEAGAEPDLDACVFDGAVGAFGPWEAEELGCVRTVEGEGFLPAPGACEYNPRLTRPLACVNGREACTVWVLGVQILCWV